MSDFVAECRREWKRLRVPDGVADEMAADLAADLNEAAAEGVSAEEVLGTDALDPRAFAASWAAERDLIHTRRVRRPGSGALALAAIVILSVAALAAGAAILAAPSRTTSALNARAEVSPDGRLTATFSPDGGVWLASRLDPPTTWVSTSQPRMIRLSDSGVSVWVAGDEPLSRHQDTTRQTIAWSLLIAGIAGVVLTALHWWRTSRRRRHQPADTDERATNHA